MYDHMLQSIKKIKEVRPVILNITNHVTMDFIANGLLSLGASPIMTQSLEEMEELIHIAQGVVINIGTLNPEFIRLCEKACSIANQSGKPIVFDPVGAGASQYRTKASLSLLEQFRFATIRGNASEIMSLGGGHHNSKGVDANMATSEAVDAAKLLSAKYNAVITVSGKTDMVLLHDKLGAYDRGHAMMPAITGSGCLLSSVISAFNSVCDDYFKASSLAVVYFGICGEMAAKRSNGPGSFKSCLIDAMAKIPGRTDYETA